MWRVGEYVRVLLSESSLTIIRETRKAIIATVNDEMSDGVTFDIILFDTYGTSTTNETMGEELNDVPAHRLSSLLAWESAPRLTGSFTIDQLRSAGSDMFRLCDWRGAIAVYSEILHHLEMGDYFFCRASEISVRLSKRRPDGAWEDCGEIDPINGLIRPNPVDMMDDVSDTRVGLFHIARDVKLHATTMLNSGRSYLSASQASESAEMGCLASGKLSYSIYLSSLADDQQIQSKGFYWRSKLRMYDRKWKASVRDAKNASQLARMSGDEGLIRECMIRERLVKKLLDEDNKSIRRAVGELMQLCSDHVDVSDPL
jgi:hypothetical protein